MGDAEQPVATREGFLTVRFEQPENKLTGVTVGQDIPVAIGLIDRLQHIAAGRLYQQQTIRTDAKIHITGLAAKKWLVPFRQMTLFGFVNYNKIIPARCVFNKGDCYHALVSVLKTTGRYAEYPAELGSVYRLPVDQFLIIYQQKLQFIRNFLASNQRQVIRNEKCKCHTQ